MVIALVKDLEQKEADQTGQVLQASHPPSLEQMEDEVEQHTESTT